MQTQRHLLGVTLGVEGEQAGEHVVANVSRPAVAPGKFLLALHGAVGAHRGLEGAGNIGLPEEQFATVDAVLEVIRKLGVVFEIEVIEAEAAGGGHITPAVGCQHRLIHLAVKAAQFQKAAAGFGWIVEAVVGAGEAFVVRGK